MVEQRGGYERSCDAEVWGAVLGGPVMKTPSSHCRGSDPAPGQGSKPSGVTGDGQEQHKTKRVSVGETGARQAGERRTEQGRGLAACSGSGRGAPLPSGTPPSGTRVCRLNQPQYKYLHL